MKRSSAVPLTLLSSLAALLISCRDKPTRYCVDDDQQVVAESGCYSGHGHWYYHAGHGFIPRGTRLSGGSFAAPSSGFSTPEAATSRGIFGHAGRSFGSGVHFGGGA